MIIEEWLTLSFTSWLIAVVIMLVLWFYYRYQGDPSVVDIGWGASIGLASTTMFFLTPNGDLRQQVVLICVALWSIRIVALLLSRMYKGQKDQRYVELSAHWDSGLSWKYFLFFQAQALSVGLLLIPIALSFLASGVVWTLWDSAGILLFSIGLLGEVIADQQMAKFRGDPSNRKGVCNIGLWRYSRHPNYFFEWIIWMSYGAFAMNHPEGVFGWISPSVILISILKITGIPPTEKRLLASKGEAYREYQRSTSMFVPMPPRSS